MRRLACLIILLAACGRIEFGAQTDAGAIDAPRPIDAPPVTCAVDGEACDDLNICSTSSICVGGTCVGTPRDPCEVANFAEEYGATQGEDGWYYGAWNLTDDTDGVYDPDTDFESFVLDTGDSSWRPADHATSPTWAYIQWWGGHPAEFPKARYPTRRWVSDVTGLAYVRVAFRKVDLGGGDGTGLIVYVDGTRVFEKTVAFDDNVGFTENIPVQLAIGTRIDIMMTYLGGEAVDTTDLAATIISR